MDESVILNWLSRLPELTEAEPPALVGCKRNRRASHQKQQPTKHFHYSTPPKTPTSMDSFASRSPGKRRKIRRESNDPAVSSSSASVWSVSSVDNDTTPRPTRAPPSLRSAVLPKATRAPGKAGSSSTKQFSALDLGTQPAKIRDISTLPHDGTNKAYEPLVEAVGILTDLGDGEGIIPVEAKSETTAAFGAQYRKLQRSAPYDTTKQRNMYGQLPPIDCIQAILDNSHEAIENQHDETFWSHHVHNAVLSAALSGGSFATRNGQVGYSSWCVIHRPHALHLTTCFPFHRVPSALPGQMTRRTRANHVAF